MDLESFQKVLNSLENDFFIFDQGQHRLIFSNKKANEGLKFCDGPLEDLAPWDIWLGFSKDEFIEAISEVSSNDTYKIIKAQQRLREGLVAPVEINLYKINFDGKDAFAATSTNASTESEDLKDLKNKELFLRKTLDSIPGGVFCKDYEVLPGRFVFWNKMAEEIWGLSEMDILGKSDYDLFPKEEADHFQEKDLETISQGEGIYIDEESVTSPTLGAVIVSTRKIPLIIKNKKYLLGISFDITKQRELEKSLKQERSIALQKSKLANLGEMASGIAHEINNPLSFIQQYNLLIRKLEEKTNNCDKTLGYTEKIDIGIERIVNIISSMKKMSRDSGEDPGQKYSFSRILDETLIFVKTKLQEFEIELKIEQNPEEQFLIDCKPNEISQVLINLINNAIRVAAELKEDWIKITIEKVDNNLKVRIIDPGKGISEELCEKIFQPFFSTSEIGEGTGLGLSISHSIISDHKGDLIYEFDGHHTNFVITLPLCV